MIFYSDEYLRHDLPGHPENNERLKGIVQFLREQDVFSKVGLAPPTSASEEDILRVHTKAHLERMRDIAKKGTVVDGDTYYTPATYETAMLAAGGVQSCLEGEVKQAFALVRPPGHHATKDKAMGFCIFNNVAIAAAKARETGVKRIAILDFDLHHGNGTQAIFYKDDILYISLHQWPHYPGTGTIEELGDGKGKGYTINIPLPGGVADHSYLLALRELVFPVLKDFSPHLLLASAGYDAHYADPLGGLRLSTNIYRTIAEEVMALSKKTVFSLEGGYNLVALQRSVYASMQGLFGLAGGNLDEVQTEEQGITEHVKTQLDKIRKNVSEYWEV